MPADGGQFLSESKNLPLILSAKGGRSPADQMRAAWRNRALGNGISPGDGTVDDHQLGAFGAAAPLVQPPGGSTLHGMAPSQGGGGGTMKIAIRPLDWVIVGGGPHGVCAGRALAAQGASVRIVEPSGALLQRWSDRAEAVGMTWMRSSVEHHLDGSPSSLDHFLHRPENLDVGSLAEPYRRPSQAAFLRHARDVAARHGLDRDLVRGRVDSIRRMAGGLLVVGEGVELAAHRVLLATGSNAPRTPMWARRLQREGARIDHVFVPGGALHLDVLGGGISAVQRALMVQRLTGKPVRLWTRRPIQVRQFDLDRSWMKHRFVGRWDATSLADRQVFLQRHARRGSVPPGLNTRLARAVRRGAISILREPKEVTWDARQERLRMTGRDQVVESSGLTLATGLEPERLGWWLRSIAMGLGLPTEDGVPVLGDDMHWGHGVHVCGPLARLRLGPMAGNLVGARWAASKLPSVRMQPV